MSDLEEITAWRDADGRIYATREAAEESARALALYEEQERSVTALLAEHGFVPGDRVRGPVVLKLGGVLSRWTPDGKLDMVASTAYLTARVDHADSFVRGGDPTLGLGSRDFHAEISLAELLSGRWSKVE